MKNDSSYPSLIQGHQNAPGYKNTPEKLVKRDQWDEGVFKRMIRGMGIKVTQQRLAILKALNSGRVHVTAQEVFEEIQDNYPDMGFATVYRFLRKLVEQQIVSEVRMGGLPARYEITPRRHHDHLTCELCGRIVEFENNDIERLQEKVAQKYGFQLTRHLLELYGHCSHCREK